MQPQLHTPGRLHSLLQISKCFASALFAIPFFQYSQHRGSIAHLPRVWPKRQVYQHLTPIFIPKTAGCVNNDHTCCMKLTCSVAASFFPLPCIYSCKLAFRFASDLFSKFSEQNLFVKVDAVSMLHLLWQTPKLHLLWQIWCRTLALCRAAMVP